MATEAPAPGAVSANKAELIAIADAVAREKLIDRMIVIEAMEDAIQRAARARYGAENDIRAKLDATSGDLRLWRVVEVVEEVDDYFKQVSLDDAQKLADYVYILEGGRTVAEGTVAELTADTEADGTRELRFETVPGLSFPPDLLPHLLQRETEPGQYVLRGPLTADDVARLARWWHACGVMRDDICSNRSTPSTMLSLVCLLKNMPVG